MSRWKPKALRDAEVYPHECRLVVPAYVRVNDDDGRKIWTWTLDGVTDDTPMVPCRYACRELTQMATHLVVTHRIPLSKAKEIARHGA